MIYALIPARGGSKSIPDKNIVPVNGKPLLAYSVEIGRAAPSVARVFVSTDSPRIREIALGLGAEAPFLRPASLGEDLSPDLGVFQHWLAFLREAGEPLPEFVLHLRATSPLRSVGMIEAAVALLRNDPAADSVRSVCAPSQNPFKMWREEAGYLKPLLEGPVPEAYNMPRQILPEVWWQTATVDLVRTRVILAGSMTGEKIKPLRIRAGDAIDIDEHLDLERARERLR